MLMVRDFIPFVHTPLATRLWQIGIAVLAGTCGNIILFYFLSTLVADQTLAGLLDWIVGFNTALTGYMLVEKGGTDLPFQRIVCIVAGLINAGLTILAINRIYAMMSDFPLIELADAVILLTIAAILSFLGGRLAEKYLKIKKSDNRING